MHILLIENDSRTAADIQMMLRSEKCVCEVTDCGEDGLQLAQLNYEYDIIILNLMLSDIDGYTVLRRLRAAKITTPVIVLSSLSGMDNEIKCFSLGADDYLLKPFDKRVLFSRIQTIVRRAHGFDKPIITIGAFSIDLNMKEVIVGGRPFSCTPKEYCILELLVLKKGKTISKQSFLNHLYDGLLDEPPQLKTIDIFVCRIRKKLNTIFPDVYPLVGSYIQTDRGRGYFLALPDSYFSDQPKICTLITAGSPDSAHFGTDTHTRDFYIEIDSSNKVAKLNGVTLFKNNSKRFQCLAYLYTYEGKPICRADLVKHVFGADTPKTRRYLRNTLFKMQIRMDFVAPGSSVLLEKVKSYCYLLHENILENKKAA